MKIVADLHIHSKYSRATSPTMDLEELDKWAKIKGITVLGTGDFTHPLWFKSLKEKLKSAEPGLFCLPAGRQVLKKSTSPTRFLLSSEISCIYKKTGKVRKVHLIILAPSFETVEKINKKLAEIGNIHSDGRPILGLDSKELLKIILDIDENCFMVPAHLWTPWFSIFGSKSGFDTIEECFDDYSKYIYAVETGLSSDPAMNWRLSQLDKVALISNSDCHSPSKIGREANVFDTELSYGGIINAIKNKNPKVFLHTIEFFPEEGKYHFDGHAKCGISLKPAESKKHKNICPVCKKPLVIGVLNRVEELADRPEGFVPKNAVPFKSLIPLAEIIADSIGRTVASTDVGIYYEKLTKNLGAEFKILLEDKKQEIEKFSLSEIAEGVLRVREGRVKIEPGYDGVYGKIKIFEDNERHRKLQKPLL
jgi:uncharacterized protein (TIGR00375 family)